MIRKVIVLLSLIVMSVGVTDAQKVSVIPTPLSIEDCSGEFKLDQPIKWYSNVKGESKQIYFDYLQEIFLKNKIKSVKKKQASNLSLVLVESLSKDLSLPEAYELEVNSNLIEIRSTSEAGLYYGLQTLMQVAFDRSNATNNYIPAFKIQDQPRFEYRGFMLDVSRHFFSKEFVKKQIDALAYFKINHLHLHLTDAAGWRIEIKKYPELTSFAAWRQGETWKEWAAQGHKYLEEGTKGAYGGYYTQEDIKEIVAYAKKHFITIIPEIEMPGHSEEVLATYPHLSCSGEAYKNADFCAGNDKVFSFLEDVLTEVIELFPSEYIHIGGDEASKGAWRKCAKCQFRMEKENLQNVDELQSYFIERINKFIKSKGRKLLGWDEILEGGLAEGATVMSWRGIEGGIKAAKTGHRAIMSPGEFCYFDAYQDAPYSLPEAIGGYLPLQKVYSYNPIPDIFTSDQASYIYGVQANLWTEYVPTEEHAEMMIYPRIFALSEVAWSMPENKSWNGFHKRALEMVQYLENKGYHPFKLSEEIGNRPEAEQEINHLGRGKKVVYNAPYSEAYTANGDVTLTDGIRGGWTYGDKRWQGFIGKDRLDVIIDLEEIQTIQEVSADIMQSPGAEVFLPSQIIVEVSEDGESFITLKDETYAVDKGSAILIKKYGWTGETKGRYVRFVARSSKDLGGWIFTDEIIIN